MQRRSHHGEGARLYIDRGKGATAEVGSCIFGDEMGEHSGGLRRGENCPAFRGRELGLVRGMGGFLLPRQQQRAEFVGLITPPEDDFPTSAKKKRLTPSETSHPHAADAAG